MNNTLESDPLPLRRPISAEPLINALHARVVDVGLLLYAAAVVYMSFVPFDFTAHGAPWSGPGVSWGLKVRPFSLPDILANIALYVPLGAGTLAVLRRRCMRRLFALPLTLLFAAALSLTVEHGQHWVASRVPALPDFVANFLGALVGAILTAAYERRIREIVDGAADAARRNWPLSLAKAAVCLLLIVQLRPYDAVVDPLRTAALLRYADFSPTAAWNNLPAAVAREVREGRRKGMHELPRVQWEYALDRLADTAGYALVVALMAAGLAAQSNSPWQKGTGSEPSTLGTIKKSLPRGACPLLPRAAKHRVSLYAWAGFVGVFTASLVTMARVFLISHGLDTMHFFCGVAGWPLGCAIAHLVLKRRTAQASDRPSELPPLPHRERAGVRVIGKGSNYQDGEFSPSATPSAWSINLPRWLIPAALTAVLAVLLLCELVPFDFGTTATEAARHASLRQVCLVPFGAHFQSRPNDAFFDISGDLLRYGLLGVCLALILRHRSTIGWRKQLLLIVALTGLIAACLEGLHLFMPSRQTDITTVLLAIGGAFAGTLAVRWVYDYRASLCVVVVDDLLTKQLIEGGLTAAPRPMPAPTPDRGSYSSGARC